MSKVDEVRCKNKRNGANGISNPSSKGILWHHYHLNGGDFDILLTKRGKRRRKNSYISKKNIFLHLDCLKMCP